MCVYCVLCSGLIFHTATISTRAASQELLPVQHRLTDTSWTASWTVLQMRRTAIVDIISGSIIQDKLLLWQAGQLFHYLPRWSGNAGTQINLTLLNKEISFSAIVSSARLEVVHLQVCRVSRVKQKLNKCWSCSGINDKRLFFQPTFEAHIIALDSYSKLVHFHPLLISEKP